MGVPLAFRSKVGRGPRCIVQADDPFISREHAIITYDAGEYFVSSLSSSGVTVDAQLLRIGDSVPLRLNSEFILAGERDISFRLVDTQPPHLVARQLDSRRLVSAPPGEVLRLGDGDDDCDLVADPELGVLVLRDSGETSSIITEDESILVHGSTTWTLHLPFDLSKTARRDNALLDLKRARLRLVTTPAHEMVEVSVVPSESGGEARLRVVVSNSRYAETLLALALKKRADLDAEVSEADAGWLSNDDLRSQLARRPGSDQNLPYLHPFRLKKLFEAANVTGLEQLFERNGGEIRLGLTEFEIREE